MSACATNTDTSSETGSIFFSINLGQDSFKRDFQFVQANKLPSYNVAIPYMASKVRTFDQMVSFYSQSPTTGKRAFELQYGQTEVIDDSYKRGSLIVDNQSDAETVYVSNEIRQILTDDRFTDIQDLSTAYADLPTGSGSAPNLKGLVSTSHEGFVIRVWYASDAGSKDGSTGLYALPTSVEPLAYILFYNPDTTTDNGNLNIVKSGKIATSTYKSESLLHRKTGSTITSTYYNDIPGAASVKALKEVKVVKTVGSGPLAYSQVREVKVAELDDTTTGVPGTLELVSKSQEVFEDIGGLSRMVSQTDGYSTGETRTTTFGYYDSPSNGNLNGRMKWRQDHFKNFVYYIYTFNGNTSGTITELHPFEDYSWNSAAGTPPVENSCVKIVTNLFSTGYTRYVYTPKDGGGGHNLTALENLAMGISGNLQLLTKITHDGQGYLKEVTAYHNSGANKGRVAWIEHADGTATTYGYGTPNGGGEYILTVSSGAGDRNGISTGTKSEYTYNAAGITIGRTDYVMESATVQTTSWSASDFDFLQRPKKKTYDGNSSDYEEFTYGCCGVASVRARDGVTTTYYKDDLKRLYKTTVVRGSETVTTTTTKIKATAALTAPSVAAADMGFVNTTRMANGSLDVLVSKSWSHLNGTSLRSDSPDQNGDASPETTTYATTTSTEGGRKVTTTDPLGNTSISEHFIDGRIKSVRGTAVAGKDYDYGSHTLSGSGVWTKVTAAGNASEWVKTYYDRLGRVIKEEYPTQIASSGTYDKASRTYHPVTASAGSRGKTWVTTDPDGVQATYGYDAQGRQNSVAQTMPNSAGTRTTTTSFDTETIATVTWITTTSKVNNIQVSKTFVSPDGKTRKSEGTVGSSPTISTVAYSTDFSASYVTTINAAGATQRNYIKQGRSVASTVWKHATDFSGYETAPTPTEITAMGNSEFITGSTTQYDGLGRVTTVTHSRTGSVTFSSFTEAGQARVTISNGGNTKNESVLDKLGRPITQKTYDLGGSSPGTPMATTHTSYTAMGQVRATWGDLTYPRFYVYDGQGRMTHLHTWQSTPSLSHTTTTAPADSSVTAWVYDTSRGWLTEKNYAGESGNGPGSAADYTYTAAGRLKTRTWERGVITTYGYEQGMLKTVTYTGETNGHTTSNLAYTYDNFGRMTNAAQGGNSRTYEFDSTSNLSLDYETFAYDFDKDGTADFARTLDRNEDTHLRNAGFNLRLTPTSTSSEHDTTYGYDEAGRLKTVMGGGAYVIPGKSHAFEYNYLEESGSLISSIDSRFHLFENEWFDHRDILESKTATKKSDSVVYSDHTYTVNALGQRTSHSLAHTAFGTQGSPKPRRNDYVYNARGELVSTDVFDISGSPSAITAQDRYFSYDSIGNRLESRTGTASSSGGTLTSYTPDPLNQYDAITGAISASPDYDDDGNATAYPLPVAPTANATLLWDAENRLVKITRGSSVTSYQYDDLGRRIVKQSGTDRTLFIYDGWNLISRYNQSGTSAPVLDARFLWGLDLSGTLQGAGGVGGLLSYRVEGSAIAIPAYDGNGNVTEILNWTSCSLRITYDAFGNMTREGSLTDLYKTPFLFSTKYHDAESGLYYYGYRYYDPVTGRWPSRDPIEEEGGDNLYEFVENNPVSVIDAFGLDGINGITPPYTGDWNDTETPYDKAKRRDEERQRQEEANAKKNATKTCCDNSTEPVTFTDYDSRSECCKGGKVLKMVPHWEVFFDSQEECIEFYQDPVTDSWWGRGLDDAFKAAAAIVPVNKFGKVVNASQKLRQAGTIGGAAASGALNIPGPAEAASFFMSVAICNSLECP